MAVKLEPAKHNGAPSRHSCKARPVSSWYQAGNWVLGSTGPAAFSEAEAEFASTKRPRRAAKSAVATSRRTEPVGDVRCASEAAAPLGAPPRLLALPANCIVVLPPRDECVRGRTRARRRGGARKGASRQTVGPRTADPACPACPGAVDSRPRSPLPGPRRLGSASQAKMNLQASARWVNALHHIPTRSSRNPHTVSVRGPHGRRVGVFSPPSLGRQRRAYLAATGLEREVRAVRVAASAAAAQASEP